MVFVASTGLCKAQQDPVKAIVDMGVDINAVNKNGETAMHMATFSGADPVVQYLADKGARIDARTRSVKHPGARPRVSVLPCRTGALTVFMKAPRPSC